MPERRAPSPRDPVRLFAQALCVVFGLIGILPVAAEALLGLGWMQRWAADETARVLQQELGLTASFQVRLHLIPLRLRIDRLVVPASDGGGPALEVESLSVSPRLFGLLAGRLDAGDVEIDAPRARLVIRDGKLVNVRYRLPKLAESEQKRQKSPFGSLAVSEARFALDLEGTRIETGPVDVDVFAEAGPSFEVLLSAGTTTVDRTRKRLRVEPGQLELAHDEDRLCRLELRARIAEGELLVRRLSALAAADLDARAKTRPACDRGEEAEERVALRLSGARLLLREGELPYVAGHVVARAPLALVNRFADTQPLAGWAAFRGDVRFDGRSRLPELRGRLTGANIAFERYRLAKDLSVELDAGNDVIRLPRYEMGFADGRVVLENARIEPFAEGAPLSVERVDGKGILFESMMRDFGVTPDTIVRWTLSSTRVTKIRGTLSPLKIDAELAGETRDFEVFDRAYHDPHRRHMIGVKSAALRGKIGVRPNALVISDTRTDFGKSSMFVKLVSIGFDNTLELDVARGSKLNLADISPLIDIRMLGQAELDVKMSGIASDPLLTGNVKIQGFEFGGFPLGDVTDAQVKFKPLWLEIANLTGQKGGSAFVVPTARLDFGTRASLLVEAHAKSQSLDLRDFFHMWHFDEDPRFEAVRGRTSVDATIRYVLGGPEDRCRGGVLRTTGSLGVRDLSLFDERYDGGRAKFDFLWDDRDAAYRGVTLDVPELVLQKGKGAFSGSISLRPGALVTGELVAAHVPLGKLDALPAILRAAEGTVSANAKLGGTLDALEADVNASISSVRVGRAELAPSLLRVQLFPVVRAVKPIGTTRCGQPITGPFDKSAFDQDLMDGVFQTSGSLFGGQITLKDVSVTRQRNKTVRGTIGFSELDLGAFSQLVPELALAEPRIAGRLSGAIRVEELSVLAPSMARGTIELSQLALERGGVRAELLPTPAPIGFGGGSVSVPGAALAITTPRGQRAVFDLSGRIAGVASNPTIDAKIAMRPTPLAGLVGLLPKIERASGSVSGRLSLAGPLASPRYAGGLELERGELAVRGLPSPITDLELALGIDGSELNIRKGAFRLGGGRVALSGGAPLRGFSLGEARVRIAARELALPMRDGVRAVADAELLVTYRPASGDERKLPRVVGNVLLRSLEYRRPVTMAADLNALAQRGKRTEFEVYDPSEDVVEFDVVVKAQRSLVINNELVDAELVLAEEGLEVAGTNARYGVRGNLRLKPGGRIVLRRSEFEIREGTVRFDDLTRIAPRVDVTAVTEYRRYSDSPGSGLSRQNTVTTPTSSTSATGGRWSIRMHAHGDADNLKVDLSSDPALAQDDIFLLLTVGLTRAELDQAQSASVGESVALEALGTLTGADRAVKNAVPLIDEFRFGSAYSSRTGRTEPTVTVGKRLTERVRANVTSGLAESREIRSNLEWRLSPRVSVEGSYDNVNDISSSSLGNLGADVRWRLEFE